MSTAAHFERRVRSAAYLREVYGGTRHWVSVTSLGATSKDDGLDETQGMCCEHEKPYRTSCISL